MRTQRRRIRIRPSRQNNIAANLLAPRPIRPRNNRRLRHAVMPHQRCLDLPRLNPEAANLNLMVRAPHKLQNPIPAPARQVPAAVHPPSRSPIPIRNKTLTRQPATTNISPPNPNPRPPPPHARKPPPHPQPATPPKHQPKTKPRVSQTHPQGGGTRAPDPLPLVAPHPAPSGEQKALPTPPPGPRRPPPPEKRPPPA